MSNEENNKPQVGVTVHKRCEKIPATLVDICQGDIVLISEKKIMPGTEVDITMNSVDDLAIHGTIRLVLLINKEGKSQYRLGIEADQMLIPEGMLESIPTRTIQ